MRESERDRGRELLLLLQLHFDANQRAVTAGLQTPMLSQTRTITITSGGVFFPQHIRKTFYSPVPEGKEGSEVACVTDVQHCTSKRHSNMGPTDSEYIQYISSVILCHLTV